jgi:hypothetical protein
MTSLRRPAQAARWSGVELRPEDHPTWRLVFRSLFELEPAEDHVRQSWGDEQERLQVLVRGKRVSLEGVGASHRA